MSLPEHATVSVTTTETLTLELDERQLHLLILEWAKTRGFSHRADVDLDHFGGEIGALIKETRTKTE